MNKSHWFEQILNEWNRFWWLSSFFFSLISHLIHTHTHTNHEVIRHVQHTLIYFPSNTDWHSTIKQYRVVIVTVGCGCCCCLFTSFIAFVLLFFSFWLVCVTPVCSFYWINHLKFVCKMNKNWQQQQKNSTHAQFK